MIRSTQQNKLYHELCGQLKATKVVKIYDGRFEQYGYQNPIVFNPRPFSYDSFRELLKACDMEYPKDEQGKPLSSTKINVDTMNSHITFIEILLIERQKCKTK